MIKIKDNKFNSIVYTYNIKNLKKLFKLQYHIIQIHDELRRQNLLILNILYTKNIPKPILFNEIRRQIYDVGNIPYNDIEI